MGSFGSKIFNIFKNGRDGVLREIWSNSSISINSKPFLSGKRWILENFPQIGRNVSRFFEKNRVFLISFYFNHIHFLIVPNTEFNSFFLIFPLGTGLQVDSFFRRRVAGFPKKGVDLCKAWVDVIFSDKKLMVRCASTWSTFYQKK